MSELQSIYFKLPKTGEEGFYVQHDDLPHFYDQLHHHPELQLIYLMEGSGDLYIGDTITTFSSGDLLLIGSNQNHLFKCDTEYFGDEDTPNCQSVSVFFHEQSLGDHFFDISEMSAIKHLMGRANRGIRFGADTAGQLAPDMTGLLDLAGFPRFIQILQILHTLAETDDYDYLAEISSPRPPSDKESRRVNDVINYILNNYKEDIELQTIADIAHYSKAAFCKFFKQRTRKTFSEFLNEVRISQACKMLQKTDLNISHIGYESGYNNISHFNRQFKKHTGLTPREYARKYERSKTDPSRQQVEHLSGE